MNISRVNIWSCPDSTHNPNHVRDLIQTFMSWPWPSRVHFIPCQCYNVYAFATTSNQLPFDHWSSTMNTWQQVDFHSHKLFWYWDVQPVSGQWQAKYLTTRSLSNFEGNKMAYFFLHLVKSGRHQHVPVEERPWKNVHCYMYSYDALFIDISNLLSSANTY